MVKIWPAQKNSYNWYMGQDDRRECHNACYFMRHMYDTAGWWERNNLLKYALQFRSNQMIYSLQVVSGNHKKKPYQGFESKHHFSTS